ncbi:Ig-like domain-containing protein [Candidatus Pseudoscillospira sp. SGI.172]|uniref:Ig-like domain-containing protein n=1 Tax=Candidatus Pseudoscillospira sp. SGI.172 TaxID=3420582 RepID=UPI0009BC5801|nr:Ig-like domain-containing protein [Pseudoflavonifractor sp.]MDY3019406.1 Ig-like domain-containing protein [Oscillospiraceae bacterium]
MKHLTRRWTALAVVCAFTLALPVSAALFGGSQELPSVAAFSKNGLAPDAISFSPTDFQVSGNADLSSIVLTSLPDPSAGMLTIANQSLPLGSEVAMSAVSGMQFTPLATPMLSATSFTFSPVFSDGTTGDDVTVGLYLLASANTAPVAENLELTTYKNVEITGTFSGVDPEGDLLTFQLVSKPARGAVTQSEDGSAAFVYTPYEDKTGKDAFTYVAVDTVGNTSAPATVSIRIEKQKTKVTYADMDGVAGHREAVRLAEAGLLIGEQMGDQYFFHPQEAMSRAQFTSLAMAAAGVTQLEGVTLTGFADDEAMATWAKTCASTALKAGLIQGTLDENGQVVFQADAPITAAEAAVVLDRALNVTDVSDAFSAAAPAWASQSVSNLASCGVVPTTASLESPLTRAEAAVLLSGTLDVLESRDSSGWFSW